MMKHFYILSMLLWGWCLSMTADICSSKLSLDDVQLADMEKNGRKLTFHYKTFRFVGVDWQINMVFTLEKGKHYMKKYLEITVPDSQRARHVSTILISSR